MTAFDRFDPFERRIGEALDGIAPLRPLDYLDDVFRQTVRTSQRPRWSFLERWLNVDTTFARPFAGRNLPIRQLIVLALLVALVGAAIAFYAGSTKRLPAPLGLAANGQLVYGIEGDLYVRDTPTGESRLLLGGPSDQGGAVLSPNGQLIAYDNVVDGVDHAWVANIDGSNPRQLLDEPFTGLTAQWSYDSTSMVLVTAKDPFEQAGYSTFRLWVAPADGSGAREIELSDLYALEAAWDPQRTGVLLVRTLDPTTGDVDMAYVDTTTEAILSRIDMPDGPQLYGPLWEFRAAAFSPDGQTIAYNVVESDPAGGQHIWLRLMNRDGSNDRPVALPERRPGVYSQAWPSFSPDGKWIAMESWVGPPGGSVLNQVALATTDGSAPTRLIGPSLLDRSLVMIWSPDGTRVLMHVNDVDDIYSIDPVTGDYERMPWKSDFPNWQRVAP